MSRAFEIISEYRSAETTSHQPVCRPEFFECNRKDKPTFNTSKIFGVVGPDLSQSTITLASLLAVHNVPVVSYSATSDELDQREERFRSFFRTVASDKTQIEAMVSMFKYFKWNYVQFIGSEDAFGKDAFSNLKEALRQTSDICLSLIHI